MILDGGARLFRRANITCLSVQKKNFRLTQANIHRSRKRKRISNLQNRSPQNPDSPRGKNTKTTGLETAQRERSDELMKVA